MNEMTKSHPSRIRAGDYSFIRGNVLDIGCGPDPIKLKKPSTVRGWDIEDGDAQYLKGVKDGSIDCIVASHVLEHVVDVEITLSNWARVLVDGGYIYILVPDFLLYEHGKDFDFRRNPSRYNADHKSSFCLVNLEKPPVNHPHYGFKDMLRIGRSAGLTLVDCRIEADQYDWRSINDWKLDQTMGGAQAQICFVYQKI